MKPASVRGCYNILHLGIAPTEVDFLGRLQDLFTTLDTSMLHELRELGKTIYR